MTDTLAEAGFASVEEVFGYEPGPVPEQMQIDTHVLDLIAGIYPSAISPRSITGDPDRGFDVIALARAYMCRFIHPDIDSDLSLHLFLARNEDRLPQLGFDGSKGVPSRGAIERFRNRVDEDARRELYYDFGYFEKFLKRKFGRDHEHPRKVFQESDEISNEEIRDAYEQVKPVLDSAIPDGRDSDKTTIPWSRFQDILGEAMLQRDSASQIISNRRRPDEPEEVEPVAVNHCDPERREMRTRTFFNGFEKNSATRYMKGFEAVFERLILRAQRKGMYDRPVDLHVDGTNFIYNPQSRGDDGRYELADGVVGVKGGDWAYQFITVTIEDRQTGRSMKPVVFPVRDRGLLFQAVAYCVRRTQEYMNIREVKGDSEFANTQILNFLEERNIHYRMRYSLSGEEIKRWLKGMSGNRIAGAKDYTIKGDHGKHETRLIAKRAKYGEQKLDLPENQTNFDDYIVDEDEGQLELTDYDGDDPEEYDGPWFVYVTSRDVPDDDASARKAANQYAKRWQIETDYRVVKHNFMAPTNSTEYEIRVLWWLYAVALFSAWKLADLAIRDDDSDIEDEPYAIRSGDFTDAIKQTAHG